MGHKGLENWVRGGKVMKVRGLDDKLGVRGGSIRKEG